MTSRLFSICLLLAIGPPLVLLAYHHEKSEARPILPGTADGQLVVFTADWCGACKAMKPIVADLYRQGFDVRVYNVDSNREKAERYHIRSIPTFVLVRGGQEVRRESGAMSIDSLKRMWR
jgi:thiol-disulfide isomerase/thioredoxin